HKGITAEPACIAEADQDFAVGREFVEGLDGDAITDRIGVLVDSRTLTIAGPLIEAPPAHLEFGLYPAGETCVHISADAIQALGAGDRGALVCIVRLKRRRQAANTYAKHTLRRRRHHLAMCGNESNG